MSCSMAADCQAPAELADTLDGPVCHLGRAPRDLLERPRIESPQSQQCVTAIERRVQHRIAVTKEFGRPPQMRCVELRAVRSDQQDMLAGRRCPPGRVGHSHPEVAHRLLCPANAFERRQALPCGIRRMRRDAEFDRSHGGRTRFLQCVQQHATRKSCGHLRAKRGNQACLGEARYRRLREDDDPRRGQR